MDENQAGCPKCAYGGHQAQIQDLIDQVTLLKRKLEAKELVNAELKESLREHKEAAILEPTQVTTTVESPDTDVGHLKQKLEAKSVIIGHLKSELKSSKEIITELETEKEASTVQEEIRLLRQINETQEEKIINLTNELHAKRLKIDRLKVDLEARDSPSLGRNLQSSDGSLTASAGAEAEEEWTDLGEGISLRDEIEKLREKNKRLQAKFDAYKAKVAAYRSKKTNEKLETEKENNMLMDKLIMQLNKRNEDINEVNRELSAKQDEIESYKIREAELALKQRAENEEIIERLNQKQLEIKKLKTEKESLLGVVALMEDQSGVSNMIDELANKSQMIDELKHELRRKDETLETISNQLARDMNGLLDEMNIIKKQKVEEIEIKNAEIERLNAYIKRRSRRRSSATSSTEPTTRPNSVPPHSSEAHPPNTNNTTTTTTAETPEQNSPATTASAFGMASGVLGWFKGTN